MSSYPWVKTPEAGDPRQVTVNPGSYGTSEAAVRAAVAALPHEIRDEDIERDKPGYRGLFLTQFQGVLDRCSQGDPDDPRWDELRLRTLDRMAKLLRVYEADAPGVKQGPGNPRDLANRAAADLVELEESLAETRVK
jgi:hypothetical protein